MPLLMAVFFKAQVSKTLPVNPSRIAPRVVMVAQMHPIRHVAPDNPGKIEGRYNHLPR